MSTSRLAVARREPAARRDVGVAAAPADHNLARREMRRHSIPARRRASSHQLRCEAAFAALAFLFSGCYGDFGRPRPSIFTASRPYEVGAEAAQALGAPAARYELTDDEKQLRELAYALIRPPYSRERWFVVLGEFRRVSAIPYHGEVTDYAAYARKLLDLPARSATARYAQLIDAIRDDFVRIEQFVPVASRIADIDGKREKSLAYIADLTADESANARIRMGENAVILAWAQKCVGARAAAYRYVLERLIVATPSPKGIEAERLLIELERRVTNMYAGWAPAASAALAR
jgi:hypothetical protein